MSKVTSKLQVTLPKALASQCGIRPGDEVTWVPAGNSLRIVPDRAGRARRATAERLRLFDAATARQAEREKRRGKAAAAPAAGRGWTREDLYDRGRPR